MMMDIAPDVLHLHHFLLLLTSSHGIVPRPTTEKPSRTKMKNEARGCSMPCRRTPKQDCILIQQRCENQSSEEKTNMQRSHGLLIAVKVTILPEEGTDGIILPSLTVSVMDQRGDLNQEVTVDTETEAETEIWIEADIEIRMTVVHMVGLQILQLGEDLHVKSIGTGGRKNLLAILLEKGTEKIRAKDSQ